MKYLRFTVLVCLQMGCAKPEVARQRDAIEASATTTSRLILSSELEHNSSRTWAFGDFAIRNLKSDKAVVSLISRSCSCLKIEGLPSEVGGNQYVAVRMLTDLGPDSTSQTLGAMVRLEWSDQSQQRISIRQEVKVLTALKVIPAAFTFTLNEADRGKPDNLIIKKSLKVLFRFRGKSQVHIPKPIFADLPAFAEVVFPDNATYQQLEDGVSEATWSGFLVGDTTNAGRKANDLKERYLKTAICRVEHPAGGIVSKAVPVSMGKRRGSATAQPQIKVHLLDLK